MAMDVRGFNAPQYGVNTTKRVGVMNLVQWQESAPVVVDTPTKTVLTKVTATVQTPKQQTSPVSKVTEKKSVCWCGRRERCKEDSRRYCERLLRKS